MCVFVCVCVCITFSNILDLILSEQKTPVFMSELWPSSDHIKYLCEGDESINVMSRTCCDNYVLRNIHQLILPDFIQILKNE